MQRIQRIDETQAPANTAALLASVRRQMGGVPHILATMARSPAALAGFLGFSGPLAAGTLSAALREQIALAVAGANRCDYCASVHTALGGKHGVAGDELARNLEGRSSDPKVEAALRFVSRIVATRGQVSDEDLASVRRAEFSDEAIVELVAHTALNLFTNYFNHVADTEIDFPVVSTGALAAA